MSFRFRLDEANKLGDYDEKYGVRYWCKSTDADRPISFNSQNQDIKAGDTITAEESLNKETKKGAPYYQLRKVRVEAGAPSAVEQTFGVTPEPAPTTHVEDTSTAALLKKIDERLKGIEAKLGRLLGDEVDAVAFDPKAADRARKMAQEMQDEMPEDFLL